MHFLTIFSIESDGYWFVLRPLEGLLMLLPILVAAVFGARRLFPDNPRVKAVGHPPRTTVHQLGGQRVGCANRRELA